MLSVTPSSPAPDASAVCVLCFITLSYVKGSSGEGSPDVNLMCVLYCCDTGTLVFCYYFTSCIFVCVALFHHQTDAQI